MAPSCHREDVDQVDEQLEERRALLPRLAGMRGISGTIDLGPAVMRRA
jgi:hypothetical protein